MLECVKQYFHRQLRDLMTTILVVDDEKDLEYLVRRKFRAKINDEIYNFRFVHNGLDALTLLENEPEIDMVLLDINMPDLDGLSLLKQLPTLNPNLQIVMVSAYSDLTNIRSAMNLGAFDFVFKPIDFSDLEVTIDKTIHYIKQLRDSRQLKIIDELKTRFFDNITHEFRTPLTLILSPLEQLLGEYTEPAKLNRSLLSIERNAKHLLRLINQLLDLAKLEAGQLGLAAISGNLGEFVSEIVSAFEPLSETRGLDLVLQSNLNGLYIFDPEKIEHIVFNLLSNALKFTQKGQIKVMLSSYSDETTSAVRLVISDTGSGISAEKLPYIFNRFYQGNNVLFSSNINTQWSGTGIGLALVKELTGLMNGEILVTSSTGHSGMSPSGQGTQFTIDLPLQKVSDEHLSQFSQPLPSFADGILADEFNYYQAELPTTNPDKAGEDMPLILVVDDNTELRNFLAESLGIQYRVLIASNGADAWELARIELPDIIISDVMMPDDSEEELDGFQLIERLKNASETDHIGVILLTGKVSHQNLIEGLSKGADDYIAKPFNMNELRLRVTNLLARQVKIQEHYQKQLDLPLQQEKVNTMQHEFLKRLYNLVDTNLDAPLPVEWVADELAMSRKTLYRKVQSLTKLSPNQLIRNYRLRRASELLQSGHTVSETANRVGFETSSHFARAFKELYNQTPSEFASR